MQSAEAARIFHDWAYQEGFMPEAPITAINSTAAEIAHIQNVTELGKQLLRVKGVLSVASNDTKDLIWVFLKRAMPNKKQLALLPSTIDNIEILYRQGVPQPIGGPPGLPFGGSAFSVWQSGGVSRYTCGSSISVGNNREAGTLGCLVRDPAGTIYGLSNNHVSGSCSYAGVGLPILAPGVLDVIPNGIAPFTIGFHHSALQMVNGAPDNVPWADNSDAALFKIANPAMLSSHQGLHYDTPTQAAALADDLAVQKVGRTTGLTSGKVIGKVHGAFGISYGAAHYGFSGVVYFGSVYSIQGVAGAFSENGDSGSLVTTVDGNGVRTAVGIIVGGMQDSKAPGEVLTLALPIEPILQRLGVTLLGGHNI